ncbi:MAG: hypothetical protein ACREMK_11000 [Gemmatimonadota bacterium]
MICGCHGAAFTLVPDGCIVCPCPTCVVARIDRIETELHEIPLSLPLGLRILRAEARGEAEGQRGETARGEPFGDGQANAISTPSAPRSSPTRRASSSSS